MGQPTLFLALSSFALETIVDLYLECPLVHNQYLFCSLPHCAASAHIGPISRTILPVITQDELAAGTGRQTGLGDTTESLWFSPVKPTDRGLIWGIGPAILIPTATDDLLGGGKWGIGPTIVGLKQTGPWIIGGLANHIWSVAGSGNRNKISSTFVQPFINYITPSAWTYGLNTEASYDWESKQWAVPVNFMVSKLVSFDKQMVSFQGGVRYWVKSTDSGPEGLGLRFAVTLLFPK
jgi:hypothetical protein